MVTIRLARHGFKKNPFYHVTVAERSAKRDGRFIERVGFYNPVARGRDDELRIDLERVDYWLSTGAQPTDRVKQLVTRWRKSVAEQALADAEAAEAAEAARPSEEAASEDAESPAGAEVSADTEASADAVPSADAESSGEST